ncbi:chromate transporter [Pseudoduganella ginsengisoli]|uniref:Chromate transporter n=1 Tax=Pseudoduganella ginsengisoli TaxID=1462440 RepID=A0A6L6PW04_9BURK|nr:chromate transporter [Pseudoduganella ginsengisoli]MTW01406.1 chromate transporter [Pseudoduganella ginsengisoli]
MTATIVLTWSDWFNLFAHYLLLSLMSVGGAISTTAEMHRLLVEQHHWLTPQQFNDAIALAQAAPGPNILFVALMGWKVGLNAGSYTAAALGVAVTMTGIMLPSTTLTYMASQWLHRNREKRGVRAFKQGMSPVVVGMLVSTGIILATASAQTIEQWPLWAVSFVAGVLIWRTSIHLLWLLGAGAVLGWFQLV